MFTKDLDLPRGHRRELVRDRDRVYEINGAESHTLATIGAFRVIGESDFNDASDERHGSCETLKHLEREGLIQTAPLNSDDRAVTLTASGRDLLEANRDMHCDRSHEPRQAFYSGVRRQAHRARRPQRGERERGSRGHGQCRLPGERRHR